MRALETSSPPTVVWETSLPSSFTVALATPRRTALTSPAVAITPRSVFGADPRTAPNASVLVTMVTTPAVTAVTLETHDSLNDHPASSLLTGERNP